MPQAMREPNPADIQPPRSRIPWRGRRSASVERGLGKRGPPESPGHGGYLRRTDRVAKLPTHQESSGKHKPIPKAGTAVDADPGDRRGGATRCGQRTAMLPTLSTILPGGVRNLRETQQPLRISI